MKQGVGTILGTIGEYKPIDLSPIDKAFSSLKKEIEEEDDRYIEQKQKAIDALLKMKTEGLLNTGKNAIQKEIDKAYAEINSGNLVTPSDIQKRVFDIKNDYNVMSAETDRAKEIMTSYLEDPEKFQVVELNEETGEIEDVTQERFNNFFEIFDGEGVYDSEKAKEAMKIASSIGNYSDADYSAMEDSIKSYYQMNADKEGKVEGYDSYDTFYEYVTTGKLQDDEKGFLEEFIKQTYAPKIALEYARMKKKGLVEDGVTQEQYINTQIEKRIPGIKETREFKLNKEAADLRIARGKKQIEQEVTITDPVNMPPEENKMINRYYQEDFEESSRNAVTSRLEDKFKKSYEDFSKSQKEEYNREVNKIQKSISVASLFRGKPNVNVRTVKGDLKNKIVTYGGEEYALDQVYEFDDDKTKAISLIPITKESISSTTSEGDKKSKTTINYRVQEQAPILVNITGEKAKDLRKQAESYGVSFSEKQTGSEKNASEEDVDIDSIIDEVITEIQ